METIAKSLCVSVLLFAHPALAQNLQATPSFQDVSLIAGFEPDPRTGRVVAGGELDVSKTVPQCLGFVSEAPIVRLNYTPEPSPAAQPLFIHAFSKGDTTILVYAPDGQWYCNDDGFNGANPMLIFGPAMSGDYKIWMGSFEKGSTHSAILAFSEVGADITGLEDELSRANGR